ncbi:MAG: DUF4340 domain-containing protein [Candidatus Hydrothermae bacterium]|nr:DUF4340 domain-containing protein [Candidatus Hydrothermae bacterium]
MRGHLRWLVPTFAVLTLLLVVDRMVTPRGRTAMREEVLWNESPSAVTALVVTQGSDTLRVERQDGRWWIRAPEGKRLLADQARVRTLLEDFLHLRGVHWDQGHWDRYELTGDKAPQIMVLAGKDTLIQARAGKTGPDFTRSFLGVPKDSTVYLVRGGWRVRFNPRVSMWRNRTLLDVNVDSVQALRFREGDRSWGVVQTAAGWQWIGHEGPGPDSAQGRTYLNRSAHLASSLYADSLDFRTAGLEPPRRTLEVVLRTGDTLRVLMGNTQGEGADRQVFLGRPGDPTVYVLNEAYVNRYLWPTPATFAPQSEKKKPQKE